MSDPGPQPDPTIEPAEPNPGGPDAVAGDRYETAEPLPADPDPELNPSVEEHLPDEIAEPDDKQQEPTEGADDREPAEDVNGAEEPPA
ncbi:MAG TPA: hypothetical protein VGE77_02570 [Nocardioides sp.]